MELVSATLFIGTVVIGITQLFKHLRDKDYDAAIIIAVAVLVGALVGVFDVSLGLENISVAQGIMVGFGSVGVFSTAKQIG